MNFKTNTLWSILLAAAGATLLAFALPGKIDTFWSGFGGSLIGVALMQLIVQHRYKKNPEFKEKYEISQKDERNRYLRSKASEWSLSAYVVLAGLACVVLGIMGKYDIVYLLAYTVCVLLILYCLSWLLLSRKN